MYFDSYLYTRYDTNVYTISTSCVLSLLILIMKYCV